MSEGITAQAKANKREAWLELLAVGDPPVWQIAQVRALAHYVAAELILARGLRVSINVEILVGGARVWVGDKIGTDAFVDILELGLLAKRFAALRIIWLPPINFR